LLPHNDSPIAATRHQLSLITTVTRTKPADAVDAAGVARQRCQQHRVLGKMQKPVDDTQTHASQRYPMRQVQHAVSDGYSVGCTHLRIQYSHEVSSAKGHQAVGGEGTLKSARSHGRLGPEGSRMLASTPRSTPTQSIGSNADVL
jgi:hypothetical protein